MCRTPLIVLTELLESRRLLASGWSDVIDNPYFPLLPGTTWIYQGNRGADHELVRTTVTGDTKVIQGVTTTVVLDRAYINGTLAEKTYDFYAQDKSGNVWYFGENTKEYENGQVTSTAGSFEAGVNGAKAGIIMLAHPQVGDAYKQEVAVGVAEDEAKVLALDGTTKTPFAGFGGCLLTRESTKLEPGLSDKLYAPGVGFVSSQAFGGESETLKLTTLDLPPSAFGAVIDNPYYPLFPGTTYLYKGTNDGQPVVDRVQVTTDTKVIRGVTTTLVIDRVFMSGQLTEKTYDYFAQDKLGNVWYFGENTKEYENGQVVSTAGSFAAGVNGAKAGFIMLAHPGVGSFYYEENAAGVAVDQARVTSVSGTIKTPFASFGDCLMTHNTSAIDVGAEEKFYALGIGDVFEHDITGGTGLLKLVSIERST